MIYSWNGGSHKRPKNNAETATKNVVPPCSAPAQYLTHGDVMELSKKLIADEGKEKVAKELRKAEMERKKRGRASENQVKRVLHSTKANKKAPM